MPAAPADRLPAGRVPARHRRPRNRPRNRSRGRWWYAAGLALTLVGAGGSAIILDTPAGYRFPVGGSRLAAPHTGSNATSAASAPSATPAPPATRPVEAPLGSGPGSGLGSKPATCRYVPAAGPDDADPAAGPPFPPATPNRVGIVAVTLHTNLGLISLELDADRAPCAVNSFINLANAGYYADSACHRLTTAAIFVVQCGDPTATGSGGPGYRFDDENLPVGVEPAYPRGTLAMANAGPDQNGSQFFLVYRDSSIDPNYPVFGRVTQGLDLIDRVAAAGAPNGDGTPNLELDLESVEVAR
jgi:peptidyl-prolyl cis-trans isomerase B (cyclophilin B)